LSHLKFDIKTLFSFGRKLLNSDIEAELIIRHSLSLKREEFYLNLNRELEREKFKEIFKKFCYRKKGYPLAYITNKKSFHDLEIEVFKNVFIPRFETEEIVYQLIKKYKSVESSLDICAGTGAIGVSLLYYGFTKKCTFSDIDETSIENIKENLKKFNLEGKVIKSDLFSKIDEKFDLIISNPPYIKESEFKNLPEDVKMEPKISLLGGDDGLKYIKVLVEESYKYLNDKGILVIEMEKDELEGAERYMKNLKIKEVINSESENIIGVIFEKL